MDWTDCRPLVLAGFPAALLLAATLLLLAGEAGADDAPVAESLDVAATVARTDSVTLYANGSDDADTEAELTPTFQYLRPSQGREPVWEYRTGGLVTSSSVTADGEYFVAGGWSDRVYLFSINSSEPLWTYRADNNVKAAISADGSYIVAGSEGGKIYLFHRNDSTPLWTYQTGEIIYSIDISANGTYLVATSKDFNTYVFHKDNSTPLWNFSTDKVANAKISDDGNYVAIACKDKNVYFFNRNDNNPLWSYTASDEVRTVAISDNGNYIGAGSKDNNFYLFQKNDSEPLWSYSTSGDVNYVAMSGSGKDIVIGSTDENIYLFNRGSSIPIWSKNIGSSAITISADGEYIVAGSSNGYKTYLFHKDSDTPLWNYSMEDYPWAPSISSDGSTIVVGSKDKNVYLFTRWESDSLLNAVYVDDHWEATFTTNRANELGDYSLRVRFTDSAGNASAWLYRNGTLTVENKKPIVQIVSVSTTSALEGEEVVFNGSGYDPDGEVFFYRWSSSLDGVIDTGANISTTSLSVGNHTIDFWAKDYDGGTSEKVSVNLEIRNRPPTAYIDSIDPLQLTEGEQVTFTGSGSEENGAITDYQWRSSIDGVFGIAPSLTYYLSGGNHTIYFSVKDDDGYWSEEVTQRVDVENVLPVATILSISPPSANEGDAITFSGEGSDAVGFVAAYRWRSDIDGVFANLSTVTITSLSSGNHTIFFSVQDEEGAWSSEVSEPLNLTARPTASIAPGTPTFAHAGELVWLNGTGTGGDGVVADYLWRSDIDGVLGDDASLALANLTPGHHNLTFLVGNDLGEWSAPAEWSLRINARPTALIVSIDPASIVVGEPVTFAGGGSDPEGALAAYAWRSDLAGPLGSEVSFTTSVLPAGDHTIFLKVRDGDGAWSSEVAASLHVNAIPVAAIVSMLPNPVKLGDEVYFVGSGNDEGGFIAEYEWSSDLAGSLSSEVSFSISTLEAGIHTVTLRVRDDDGAWSAPETAILTVNPAPDDNGGVVVVDDDDGLIPAPGFVAVAAAFAMALRRKRGRRGRGGGRG